MTEQAEQVGDNGTRARVNRARLWALAKGCPIDAQALHLVLTVKSDSVEEPFDRWTLDGLADLMWSYVPQRCASAGVARPKLMAEALWVYLAYLAETTGLGPQSDDLPSLQASLVAYGGLDRQGRSRASVRARAQARTRAASSGASTRRTVPTEAGLAPIIPLRPRAAHRSPLVAT